MISDSSVIGITTYFNPSHGEQRRVNYRTFKANLPVPLITVELSFDSTFDLTSNDADQLLQLHGGDVMWQKERLLNIALSSLPPSCSIVCWFDADVILTNPTWVDCLEQALRQYTLVQLFDTVLDIEPPPATTVTSGASIVPLARRRSYGYMLRHNKVTLDVFARCGVGRSIGYSIGYAWAAHRNLLDSMSFYDSLILGGGDKAIAAAVLGRGEMVADAFDLSISHKAHFCAWANTCHCLVDGNVGYVSGTLLHLWHGLLANRRYSSRYAEFSSYDFDPIRDICLSAENAWIWATNKKSLHHYVADYITTREITNIDTCNV